MCDGYQEEVTEREMVVNNKISSMLASRTRKLTNVSMPKANLSDSHIFRFSPSFKVGMKEVEEVLLVARVAQPAGALEPGCEEMERE